MKDLFETAAVGVEVVGVALLVVGLAISTGRFVGRALRGPARLAAYQNFREELARTLLLTLEFLIAADVIYTIAVEQSFASLGMLALLVVIRTFLSFSLQLELTGRWPWHGGGETPGSEEAP